MGRKPGKSMQEIINVPEETEGRIREIVMMESDSKFDVVAYSNNELMEAREILVSCAIKPQLIKAIDNELAIRNNRNKSTPKAFDNKMERWFSPLWWAVMALFGKGDCSIKDARTWEALSKIKPEWKNNCSGADV